MADTLSRRIHRSDCKNPSVTPGRGYSYPHIPSQREFACPCPPLQVYIDEACDQAVR